MAIDIERERRKQAEIKKRASFSWKPEKGENIVRVFKFSHKVTKEDVKAGLFPKESLDKKIEDWDREVLQVFRGEGKDKGKESYKYALNMVDMSTTDEKKIDVWLAPRSVREAIAAYLADEDYGEDIFGCEGRDFKIIYDKNEAPNKMYKTTIRDEKHCKELDEDLTEQVKDFYDAEVYAKYNSSAETPTKETPAEDDTEVEEEPVVEKPKKKKAEAEDELE